MKKILGLLRRAGQWRLSNSRKISSSGIFLPSVPNMNPSSPWLRRQMMQASELACSVRAANSRSFSTIPCLDEEWLICLILFVCFLHPVNREMHYTDTHWNTTPLHSVTETQHPCTQSLKHNTLALSHLHAHTPPPHTHTQEGCEHLDHKCRQPPDPHPHLAHPREDNFFYFKW